ncbi:hypothetical protein L195_g056316 [Trifolium pratense]|uniref:Uncharacterized protein n=1 Tax=Trifolium pratense TaxID=57577 RepID=A0A2K3KR04_TRIPR|nr:hypothetical protein L195_g056316 [Trifolium pratense]
MSADVITKAFLATEEEFLALETLEQCWVDWTRLQKRLKRFNYPMSTMIA